ncbi:MAG: type II secretion system F family protein [Patescibacteria group bacterium]|nr:type II secretion system F family protein [Patescibacteria group bacterium]
MNKYFYTAKSLEGKTETGVLSAKDTRQLAQELKSRDLILINAQLDKPKSRVGFSMSLPFLSRVSLTEKMMFARNLQVMVAAGLPLSKSLFILSEQTKNLKLKAAIIDIQDKINKGYSFSAAMESHSDIFSELFYNMVKVGEESGTMENVLKNISLQFEREHELRSKIQNAMAYPVIVVLAMVGIGILMLVTVVPQISDTFKDLGMELPFTTKLIINIGLFLAKNWYLMVVVPIFLVVAIANISKIPKWKILFDTILLKIPVVSPIIKQTNAATTIRTLSSLIDAGVPIAKSLEIVADTLSNHHFKQVMIEASQSVRRGENLSVVLEKHQNLYPSTVFQMTRVGEETGETSKIFSKLADYFEEEVGTATQNLASVVEPLLMLIVGATIGFFAISMIQPMYSMLEGI